MKNLAENYFTTSLLTFEQYGQRFGGIARGASPEGKPHFKHYKLAGFDLAKPRMRDAQRLTSLPKSLQVSGSKSSHLMQTHMELD